MSEIHNVFVSHRHEDDTLVGDLKKMLAGRGVDVRDSSVTSDNPNQAKNEEYIKSILRDRIEWAGKIIVIVSPDTKNHEWVDWEIEYANGFEDKQIIGVWAPGSAQGDMPESLEDYADAIVNWDAEAIIDALNGKENWTDPNGGDAPTPRIRSVDC